MLGFNKPANLLAKTVGGIHLSYDAFHIKEKQALISYWELKGVNTVDRVLCS